VTLLQQFFTEQSGFEVPNRTAAAQQLFCISCVYENQATLLGTYLEPEGAVIAAVDRTYGWNPHALVCISGVNRYFIIVEGTLDVGQTFGQGAPVNLSQYYHGGPGGVGAFWWDVYIDAIKPVFAQLPLDNPDTLYYFCGHSLGGAVATIGAYELATMIDPSRVQLISFGQPRTFTKGVTQPGPKVHIRYWSALDFVPNYPGTGNGWILADILTPSSWFPGLQQWTHFGASAPLAADGTFAPEPTQVAPMPPGVSMGSVIEHGLTNYTGRILAGIQETTKDPVGIDAAGRAFDVLNIAHPGIAPDLDVLQLHETPLIQTLIEARIGGSTYQQTSPSGGGAVATIKHTWLFFDQVGATWTETYWITATSARSSFANLTLDIINKRLAFLWQGNKLRSIRASEYQGNRTVWTQIYNLGGTGLGIKGGGQPEVTEVACVYNLVGLSGGQRKIWFRGLDNAAVGRDGQSGNDVLAAVTRTNIGTWLSACQTLGYAIRWRSKPNIANNTDVRFVVGVTSAPNAQTTLSVSSATGYAVGNIVNLSLFNPKDLPRLNGLYQIVAINGNVITINYQTPVNATFPNASGHIRLILANDLSTIDPVNSVFDHFGGRQTKEDFTRSRGASRAKRLRLSL